MPEHPTSLTDPSTYHPPKDGRCIARDVHGDRCERRTHVVDSVYCTQHAGLPEPRTVDVVDVAARKLFEIVHRPADVYFDGLPEERREAWRQDARDLLAVVAGCEPFSWSDVLTE